ncbi:MAG: hypothetical protein V4654_08865 [Bdellovibrionota bacterium]
MYKVNLVIGVFLFISTGCASFIDGLKEDFSPPRLEDMKNAPVNSRAWRCYRRYDCVTVQEKDAANKEREIFLEEDRRQNAIKNSAPPVQVDEAPSLPPGCVDIFTKPIYIVQKLDKNSYELTYSDGIGSKKFILVTDKANYNTPGKPVGIGVKGGGMTTVQLKNGFKGSVAVYKECAIIPYKTKNRYNPEVSFRDEIDGQ